MTNFQRDDHDEMSDIYGREDGMREIARFVYEIGLLKRLRRSGWWVAGVDDPESVGEHSFRTSVIGYVLATIEGADPYKTAVICLFHDVPETRVGDLHRINRRYLDHEGAEKQAMLDQTAALPGELGKGVRALGEELFDASSPEAILARDADVLECLVQAKEYEAQGCSSVTRWIQNSFSQLRSEAARNLAQECMDMDPKEWWHHLQAPEKPGPQKS